MYLLAFNVNLIYALMSSFNIEMHKYRVQIINVKLNKKPLEPKMNTLAVGKLKVTFVCMWF